MRMVLIRPRIINQFYMILARPVVRIEGFFS